MSTTSSNNGRYIEGTKEYKDDGQPKKCTLGKAEAKYLGFLLGQGVN